MVSFLFWGTDKVTVIEGGKYVRFEEEKQKGSRHARTTFFLLVWLSILLVLLVC